MLADKDPAIKLFGKTIQLGFNSYGDTMIASRIEVSAGADDGCDCINSDGSFFYSKQSKDRGNEMCSTGEQTDDNQGEESSSISILEQSKATTTQSTATEIPSALSNDKDCSSQGLAQKEDHSDQASTTQSEGHKKPDEIIPCPRCKSMDTKFCYFNNYNVNQPRHFCKQCQRYWTAGGTMRNVPVGSGRRKNKGGSSCSHPRHLAICEDPSGLTHQGMSPNMRFPGFESRAFTLKRGENPSNDGGLNGFVVRPEVRIPFPGGDLGSNQGKGTSQGLIPPQMACFPASPWPYPWNPIPWQSLPFYSASPRWICNPPVGPWNFHLLPNPSSTFPDPPNSPFLGKHPRDGTVVVPSDVNKEELTHEKRTENQPPQLRMPKTLRITDDPTEVARSSLCGSLAIKKDETKSSNIGVRMFGGFHQHKCADPQRNDATAEGSHLANLSNPAAFSRSLSFHEVGQ